MTLPLRRKIAGEKIQKYAHIFGFQELQLKNLIDVCLIILNKISRETFKETCVNFVRNQVVFEILNFVIKLLIFLVFLIFDTKVLIKANFDWWKPKNKTIIFRCKRFHGKRTHVF